MTYFGAKKKRGKTQKEKASTACSRYIRLRDAIAYCDKHSIDLSQFNHPEDVIGQCCTCGAVKSWIRMDAGHYKGRGLGGSSGTYFDERNIHLQCKPCNAWEGGKPEEHAEHIKKKYGQAVLDDIRLKCHIPLDSRDLPMQAMEIFYQRKYDELVTDYGL